MNTTFAKHSDPSHGWLEVDEIELKQLGINSGAFTDYSFRKGHILYLEEDCDASKFLALWKDKFGEYPRIFDHYHDFDFPEHFQLYGIHE